MANRTAEVHFPKSPFFDHEGPSMEEFPGFGCPASAPAKTSAARTESLIRPKIIIFCLDIRQPQTLAFTGKATGS
jgi:hypothetical protein